MDNLLLSVKEYLYIRKHKLNFETRYHVKLILPEVDVNNAFCASDVIFATIHGEEQNVGIVKQELLKLKSEGLKVNQDCVMFASNVGENVPVITLSDSESDSSTLAVLSETKNASKQKKKRKRKKTYACAEDPSVSSATEASSNCNLYGKRKFSGTISSTTELVSFSNTTEENCTSNIQEKGKHKKFKGQLCRPLVSVNHSTIITEKTVVTSNTITSENANDSIVVLNAWAPIDEFIPLNKGKVKNKNTRTAQDADESVVILDDDIIELNEVAVPRPISKDPKLLRPIIIDGSNVARAHGKHLNTYSCKGIQICVDYFVKRGHTQITVFVPLFRKHKTIGVFPTTDAIILEDLEKCQRLVFTPSRNLNGKRVSCYDDRFIVEHASTTNGVIVSNDNYKDLMDVKEFKKTIEERLLMFVFVGDTIMFPNDPLGRNGPCLDDFLLLPPE